MGPAEAVVRRLDWPALRVDRWQMRAALEKAGTSEAAASTAGGGGVIGADVAAARRHALGLWSEGVLTARIFGWKSPRLKGEAMALLRAAAEAANLTTALELSAEYTLAKDVTPSARNALLAALRKG